MRETINRKKKIAPIVVAVLVVLYIGPLVLMMAALAAVIGGLILFQHRGNLQRLFSGTENKLSFHRKKGGT